MSHPIVADRSKLAAICIDMGSVVVDERLTWGRWHSYAIKHLKRRGIDVTPLQLRQAVRTAMLGEASRASSQALVALGADPDLTQEVWKEVGNLDRPLAYAGPALARLSARYPLVLVANQGLHARGLLQGAGLHSYFRHLLFSDEIGIAKPDERIFRMALDHLQIEPGQVAMLGDRFDLDIEPSKRLGMLAIRIRRGPFASQKPAQPEHTPHLTFNSLTNAARWLAP